MEKKTVSKLMTEFIAWCIDNKLGSFIDLFFLSGVSGIVEAFMLFLEDKYNLKLGE
jgi:hypothetical protein